MSTTQTIQTETNVVRVRFDHRREALGIGTPTPRISWWVETEKKGWMQAAYAIEAVTPSGECYGETGKVASSESVWVDWPFEPLTSRRRLLVRVRVWGDDGEPSAWSEPVAVEAGLLVPDDWAGEFVRPEWDEDVSEPQPGPLLRRAFTLRDGIAKARLYVTALGVYEASLNGKAVGDEVMAPGWTSYRHRLRYQIFDVTEMVQAGPNVLGAMLGDGWFRGRLGFGGGRPAIYGDRIALLAQLEVEYADGETARIVTDEGWRAQRGPIVANDIYDGETYDARLEQDGWSAPGFDDSAWAGVETVDWDFETLFAPLGPPVRRTEVLEPQEIFESPTGKILVDFGQNLVGKLRLTVSGPAGQTITLRHAEVLEDGELGTRPLRNAEATDRYTLRGSEPEDPEVWEPRFTFHGFRYAEVEGWPGELKKEDLQAVVCHSDMERTGWFECSNPLINQFHKNVVWGMRGNFLSIPTDCPQRDERLGWTGDIQVFTPTASFLYDAAGFLASWLADVAADQTESGVVPFVVPNIMGREVHPAAAWGDAGVIVPWVLYRRFGDAKILADQFDSMKAWVDHIDEVAGENRLWDQGFQFGDWLDPAAPPENPGAARTPGFIVATAYLVRSAELLGQAAEVLGREAEAAHYLGLADEVREAFNYEYVTPAGRVISDAATAYALALEFALLPEASQRKHAAERLAALVRGNGYRINTGFVGTPLICDALTSEGHMDTAYRLLTQTKCPSWLYPVTMGATTIWERWDSMLPDGSINPGEMTSFNHYALGAVADWMHRTVAGLAPDSPGYRRLRMQPQPGGRLTHAKARHATPYGFAACAWKVDGDDITVEIEVPPNTTASVALPGKDGDPIEVGAGVHTWTYPYQAPGVQPKPLSLDSTIGDIIDDEEAFNAVLDLFPGSGSGFVGRALFQEQITLRRAFGFMPGSEALMDKLSELLEELNERL
jgi:alpha-L-rhamnosidase